MSSTPPSTPFLNPPTVGGRLRRGHRHSHEAWRSNVLSTKPLPPRRRSTAGAAFCAVLMSSSESDPNGTQDVNDPASVPRRRPRWRFGVVHVLGSRCRVDGENVGRFCNRKYTGMRRGTSHRCMRVSND